MPGHLHHNVEPTDELAEYFKRISQRLASLERAISQPSNVAYAEGTHRNLLDNAKMSIRQRGTVATGITTGVYTADRWVLSVNNAGTWRFDITESGAGSPGLEGIDAFIRYTCTTAKGTLGANDWVFINHPHEGVMFTPRAHKGFPNSPPWALSLWARSSIANYRFNVELRDEVNLRHIVVPFQLGAADTWQKCTAVIPPDTTGQLPIGTAYVFVMQVWLAAGSTYNSGSPGPNAWAPVTNIVRGNGVTNLAATANQWFDLTGVQLEVGSAPSRFELLPYDYELRHARRYFQSYVDPPLRGVIASGLGAGRMGMILPVSMRAAPTLQGIIGTSHVYDGSITSPIVSYNTGYNTPQHIEYDLVLSPTALTVGRPGIVFNNNSGTWWFTAD